MSAIATAVIGAAVVGAAVSSDASRHAANVQSDAANKASDSTLQATRETNALNENIYNQNNQNQAPWLKSGGLALAALTGGLGLGNPYQPTNGAQPNATTGGTPGQMTAQNLTAGQTSDGVPQPATNGTNSSTGNITGLAGSATNPTFTDSSGNVVDANGNPVAAPDTGLSYYGDTNDQLSAAAGTQVDANGVGNFTKTFAPSDLTTDPSYQWRLDQGNQALAASAAAHGTTGSGQNLKDIVDYSQGSASTEYQAAYDRFMTNQNTAYNRLAGLAGVGQTTASGEASAGSALGGQISSNTMAGTASSNNYLTSGAAANAAGAVGSANAISGGLNNAVGNWTTMQYLNGKYPGATPASTSPTNAQLEQIWAP